MSDSVTLLKRAVASIVRHAHPGNLLEGDQAITFLTQDGIRYGRFSMANGMLTGFPASGAAAIAELARDLRHRKRALAHGVAMPELATAIATEILDRFGTAPTPLADAVAWSAIETAVDSWFAAAAIPRQHYVPCAAQIAPPPSTSAPSPSCMPPISPLTREVCNKTPWRT